MESGVDNSHAVDLYVFYRASPSLPVWSEDLICLCQILQVEMSISHPSQRKNHPEKAEYSWTVIQKQHCCENSLCMSWGRTLFGQLTTSSSIVFALAAGLILRGQSNWIKLRPYAFTAPSLSPVLRVEPVPRLRRAVALNGFIKPHLSPYNHVADSLSSIKKILLLACQAQPLDSMRKHQLSYST